MDSPTESSKTAREEEGGRSARFEQELEKLRLEVDEVKRQLAELHRATRPDPEEVKLLGCSKGFAILNF